MIFTYIMNFNKRKIIGILRKFYKEYIFLWTMVMQEKKLYIKDTRPIFVATDNFFT